VEGVVNSALETRRRTGGWRGAVAERVGPSPLGTASRGHGECHWGEGDRRHLRQQFKNRDG